MQKWINLLFSLSLWILCGFHLNGQSNLDLSFTDGQPQFAIINMDANNPSYTLSVNSGILKITTQKKTQDWSFLGIFGKNINLSTNKTVQFYVKSDINTNLSVRLKSPKLSKPTEMTEVTINQALTAGGFKYYFFDISSLASANADFQISLIQEIHLEVSNGWTSATNGNVEMDFLRLGFAEELPGGGTGLKQNFNGGMPSGLTSTGDYSLAINNGALEVTGSRSQRWIGFDYNLGATYDLSTSPYVNLKIKTNKEVVLQMFLVDGNGGGYQAELTGSQYPTNELKDGKNEFRTVRLFPNEEYTNVCFDFTGALSSIVNLQKIAKIKIVANGTALTFNGKFFIDEWAIGDSAFKHANIGYISAFSCYNAPGKQYVILVPEIQNASGLTLSSSALIENVVIDPIQYINVSENGRSVKYGSAKIHFTAKENATGEEMLQLTATGNNGFANVTVPLKLSVAGNLKPTIDPLINKVVKVGEHNLIRLSGISDGDKDAEQLLKINLKSTNPGLFSTLNVQYVSPGKYGQLDFVTSSADTGTIDVWVVDDAKDSIKTSFFVQSYASLNNPPTFKPVGKQNVINNAGEQTLIITGISDGDQGNQELTFSVTSSSPDIIPQPQITYQAGDTMATLIYTPVSTAHGSSTITITISDNGGNAENNGNKSVNLSFEVESLVPPIKGYELNLSDPNILSIFGPEGNGINYILSIVDTLGEKALRIIYKDKWTYAGIWTQLPSELNLSETPVVSYEVFSKGQSTYHWNYLYDAHGTDGGLNRNIANTGSHTYQAPANTWTTLSYDYRQAGDLNNNAGNPIDASRINAMLINMHTTQPTWPFTNTSGIVYYRKIRFGNQASFPALVPASTLNNVAPQMIYDDVTSHKVVLSGISDGNGSTEGIIINITIPDTNVVNLVSMGTITAEGNTDLNFKVKKAGNITLFIKVSKTGSTDKVISFPFTVISKSPSVQAQIDVDRSQKKQTIRGFGTFQFDKGLGKYYIDMGSSAIRLGIIGNVWEPVNDNNDPNVLNLSGFNYDAFDWDFLRSLKEQGIKTFILTSWSPPAWMKRNLSLDHKEQAIAWENTDNILDPIYYDEFAESMVGLVRAFKEEAGIDLTAIGLQNEPFFNEPYPSANLSPSRFTQLLRQVGERFHQEGLDHVSFYMPEQVFGNAFGDYSNDSYLYTIKATPSADKFCKYFAVHGYDGSGVTQSFPSYKGWADLFAGVSTGTYPKELWMTETHIGYNGWEASINLAGALHGSLYAGNISLWTNWSFGDMQMTKNRPNSSYYVSQQFFKHIRPGAVRVETSVDHPDILATAYENEDGAFSMVIINKGNSAVPLRLTGDGLPMEYIVYRSSATENHVNLGGWNLADGPLFIPASAVVSLESNEVSSLLLPQLANITVERNSGQNVIQMAGISKSDGSTQNLVLSAQADNSQLFSEFTVSAIQSDKSASLTFTPAQSGSTKVTLTLSDNSGNSIQSVFYITVKAPVGINNEVLEDITIYPNPASDWISFRLNPESFSQIRIMDLSGRIIKDMVVTGSENQLNISNFPKGIYMIRFIGNNKSLVKHFVVK